MNRIFIITLFALLIPPTEIEACSMFYFVDNTNGKIYFINNEDYWCDTKAYIQIYPKTKDKYARLWYGWDNFAQGGINEFGLVFDAAVTPKQTLPEGFHNPNGRNVGDEILSSCKTVEEAVDYLEKEGIGVSEGHLMFGDQHGNALVVEWVNGERKIIQKGDYKLITTNYLLSAPDAGNYPCYRYQSIEKSLDELHENHEDLDLKKIGNAINGAVQTPFEDENGRIGGTLYTTFINVSDMELTLVYKLDNTKITRLDLKEEFQKTGKQKIKLK